MTSPDLAGPLPAMAKLSTQANTDIALTTKQDIRPPTDSLHGPAADQGNVVRHPRDAHAPQCTGVILRRNSSPRDKPRFTRGPGAAALRKSAAHSGGTWTVRERTVCGTRG